MLDLGFWMGAGLGKEDLDGLERIWTDRNRSDQIGQHFLCFKIKVSCPKFNSMTMCQSDFP
jgi:hypothetical protein